MSQKAHVSTLGPNSCRVCQKKFDSEFSLEQHMVTKHSNNVPQERILFTASDAVEQDDSLRHWFDSFFSFFFFFSDY